MREEEIYVPFFAKIDKICQKACCQSVSEYGFTPNEILVIMFLADHQEQNSATEIAQYRNISKGLIAKSVESLCEKEYLTTERDASDRRLVRLNLTKKSQKVVQQVRQCKRELMKEIISGIPEEDLTVLHRTSKRMEENLRALNAPRSNRRPD